MIEIRAEFLGEKEGISMEVEASTATKAARLMELSAISKYAREKMVELVKEVDQAAVEALIGKGKQKNDLN